MALAAAPSSAQSDGQNPPFTARELELPGFAVTPVDSVELAARMAEAETWIHDFTEWNKWAKKYLNKNEAGWFSVRDRRPRPEPPDWLEEDCRSLLTGSGTIATACGLLADWKDDPSVAIVRREIAGAQAQREAPTKTSWWEHVHFDGLWAPTTSTSGAFGLFGVHATVDLYGRVQVFVAPGAMLVRIPTANGDQLQAAPVWGFSYRLTDFKFPGTQKAGTLHVNIVRAWIFTPIGGNVGGTTTVNLAGFSLSLK